MTGSTPNKIFNEEYNFINSLYENEYYIKDDKIYYIDEGILKVINSSNKLLESYDDIKPISFYENELLYVNENNNLVVKDVLADKVIIEKNLKVIGYDLEFLFYKYDGEYHVSVIGDYLYDDDEIEDVSANFKKFVTDNNLGPVDYEKIYQGDDPGNVISYEIIFDENGNFISGEFIGDEYWGL